MVKLDGDQAWSSKADGGPMGRDANCMYTTVRKYHCSTHEDENSEQPVRRCEKTVQVLRQCVGRPAEVVDSRTEYSEGDVPSEMLEGSRMNRSVQDQQWSSWDSDGRRDVMPRSFLGSLDDLLHAAEEAAQEFAGRFAVFSEDMNAWPQRPSERFPRSRFGEDGPPASGRGAGNDKVPNFDDFAADSKEL